MWILIAKCYQNDVRCFLASIALAKSVDFWSNKPESCCKGVCARVCTHADSRFTCACTHADDSRFTSPICFAFGFNSLGQNLAGCCELPFLIRLL